MRIKILIRLFALTILISGCESEENIELPRLNTKEIENISQNSASCGGVIYYDGGDEINAKGVCWSTEPNPGLENNFTNNGSGNGDFDSNITGLNQGTTYYVRAYATNKEGTEYGEEKSFTTFMPDGTAGTATDVDGNVYNTVHINGVEWMTENLKTTKFNDGTSIPHAIHSEDWINLETGAYCWYDNNESLYKDLYGALYNGPIVENENLCPAGWRVASNEEWYGLVKYVRENGYQGNDAIPLKATFGWYDEGNGTDNYGFKALPAGARDGDNGTFYGSRYYTTWWTSSRSSEITGNTWTMKYNSSEVDSISVINTQGYSIRCVKNLNY